MHTFKCYLKLAFADLRGRLIHKLSPLLYVFGLMLSYLSAFLGIWVIMNKFGAIKSWSLGQIVFIYIICLMSYGIRCLFFIQFTQVGNMVKQGDMDRVLVRPLNPLIYIMGNRFEIGGFAHLTAGIILFIIFHKQFGVIWSFVNILFFILSLISAALVQGAITIFIGTCSFFIVDTGGLNSFYGSLREFIWYPVTLYNNIVKFILFFIMPLAFASYVPAGIFLSNPEYGIFPRWVWQISLLSGVILFVGAYAFWNFGLKHYQSTGN